MRAWIGQNWFLLGVILVLSLSSVAPPPARDLAKSPLAHHIGTACVIGIFLVSGLTLRTRQLGNSLAHWRLHAFIQTTSFGIIPLLCYIFDHSVGFWLFPSVRHGLYVLACVPTTISSCVALTRLARGNEAGALANSALGNLLGVILTPLLILLFIGRSHQLNIPAVMRELGLIVVLPVVVGQITQFFISPWLNRHHTAIAQLSPALLLILMLQIFSMSFGQIAAPMPTVILLIVTMICAHLAILALSWTCSGWHGLGFTIEDRIAATLTSSQKTIAQGLPMILILFANSPDLALLTLPLVIYHPVQLTIDGILAPLWRPWWESHASASPAMLVSKA